MVIPKQIDIEVTSACNLKCRYCPGLGTKPKFMDLDIFKSIIDRVDFETTIVPWLNGEPLLHPQYFEMLNHIEKAKLRYYVTTNGTIFKKDVFDLMLADGSSCYQIIVSLDGLPSSESIHLARPGTDEDQVMNTIHYLQTNKTKGNTEIAVKICRRGQDWEEVEKYISYWLNVGIDFVIVGDTLAEENNPVGFRRYPCQYSDNNFMVIKVDGRMVRCAYNTEATNNEIYTMGRLDTFTPLLDIYNNDTMRNFRDDQSNGLYPGPCNTCGFAYTGMGFRGKINFRDSNLIQEDIYYQKDYYNSFFSLKKRWKDDGYYKRGNNGSTLYNR